MKISYEILSTSNGYEIRFKNDPKIEQFFKEISQGNTYSYMGYNCYIFTDMDKINPDYYYQFRDQRSLYNGDNIILSILSVNRSSIITIPIGINGLINIQKWESDFNNEVRKFVNEVIIPYYRVKKYCEFKGNQLVNGQVINKEQFSRFWYGFYKNYKKSILDYCEGIKC
jgi:hypothetical protein